MNHKKSYFWTTWRPDWIPKIPNFHVDWPQQLGICNIAPGTANASESRTICFSGKEKAKPCKRYQRVLIWWGSRIGKPTIVIVCHLVISDSSTVTPHFHWTTKRLANVFVCSGRRRLITQRMTAERPRFRSETSTDVGTGSRDSWTFSDAAHDWPHPFEQHFWVPGQSPSRRHELIHSWKKLKLHGNKITYLS